MNRTLLILGLGFVTIWDTITTIYGTYTILGGGTIQLILSILFGLLLTAYLIRSIPIIKNPSEEIIPVGAKILWFFAILYDLFTAYTGNFDLVLGNVGGTQKIIIAIGLTIFICSSPIGLSQLLYKSEEN
jgi:hypothetical protein